MDPHSREPFDSDPESPSTPRPVPPEPNPVPDATSEAPPPIASESSSDQPSGEFAHPPTVHRDGDTVVVEHGGLPPTDSCIRCGRPSHREVAIALRHPAKPATWFGRRPVVDLGLCRGHFENRAVTVALTWSMLGVGVLLVIVGILALSPWTGAFGVGAMAISGVFRAGFPITSRDADEYRLVIQGAGERYLRRLPGNGDGERE